MEYRLAAFIVPGTLLVLGAVLGRYRERCGVVLLLAVVVPTSSLPWYLGLPDTATPMLFTLGLLGGAASSRWGARSRGSGRRGFGIWGPPEHATGSTWVRVSARAFLLTVGVSVVAALCRLLFQVPELAGSLTTSALASIHLASPGSPSRSVHYALLPWIGLGTFFLVASRARDPSDRDVIARAWLAGALLTVSAPALQIALSWPLVARPDNPAAPGTGWVAFFQDPHALGAYLVLVIAVAAGLLMFGGSARSWSVAGLSLTGLAACWLLVKTDSRSAMLGGAVAIWVLMLIGAVRLGRERPRRRALAASLALAMPIGVAALALSDGARSVSADIVESAGAPRIAATLQPGRELAPVASRRIIWRRAVDVSLWYPITGVGPGGLAGSAPRRMVEAPIAEIPSAWLVENAHNYMLQLAAEFGWPGAISFGFWWLAILVAVCRSVGDLAVLPGDRALAAGVASGMIGFTVVLMAAHPLLLPELQVAVFALAALVVRPAGQSADGGVVGAGWSRALVGVAGLYVLLAGIELAGSSQLRPGEVRAWGVYGWEDVSIGDEPGTARYRWTSARARVEGHFERRFVTIPLRVARAGLDETPADVRILLNGAVIDEIHVVRPLSTRLTYDLPAVRAVVDGTGSVHSPTLGFDVSGAFRPSRRSGSSDHRLLGAQLGRIESFTRLDEKGVGWHEWEYDPVLNRTFRWSRAWSSLLLTSRDGLLTFDVRAGQPDLSDAPVTVSFVWDGELLREARLRSSRWTPVKLAVPTSEPGVLTVHVSRTWVPAAYGVSVDGRTLGVAITEIR